MHPSVHALAQIRLNLLSVDQFLAIACGLADDNPATREPVYAAAKEARSAALLIEHLRNLFSHQQCVELQRHREREQQQQRRPLAELQARLVIGAAESGAAEGKKVPNAQLFTYSNQVTLVRASKCLVAKLAKILYLADSVLPQAGELQLEASEFCENEQAASVRAQIKHSSTQVPACDRLDNVANYSQLLRSFGELSTELVDLGHCIMLSACSSHTAAAAAASGRDEPLERDQRQFQFHQPPVHLLAGWPEEREAKLLLLASAGPSQVRPSASSMTLAAGRDTRARLEWPPPAGCEERDPHLAWPKPSDADNRIETQIQDMQILFQVNRLIIDRSILLLLSASKCCQATECQLGGLAARRAILGQIRASISIIMAIVKCAVFDEGGRVALTAAAARWQPASEFATDCQLPGGQWRQQAASRLEVSGGGGGQKAASFASRPPLASGNVLANAVTAGQQWQQRWRDNQLEQQQQQQHLAGAGACQSGPLMLGSSGLNFYSGATLAGISSAGCAQTGGAKSDSAISQERARAGPESPLQIMNYFLQTWNGTSSAHESINKLQVLVEPFARLASLECLAETLQVALESLAQLNGSLSGQRHWRSHNNSEQEEQEQQQQHEPMEPPLGTTHLVAGREEKENSIPKVAVAGACGDLQTPEHKAPSAGAAPTTTTTTTTPGLVNSVPPVSSMSKRQLAGYLNALFLGPLRGQLVERAHEFTDCAYTKHEHRESILLLMHCLKLQLNRFVKLIYRLQQQQRRRAMPLGLANENELSQLGQLRQLAGQLGETCAELKYELQSIVIELSDDLDRCNSQLELIKQLKHHCLAGGLSKAEQTGELFRDQAEQLVEVCKMLNQVAPTNKMKITTKSLAIWFELNSEQLLAMAHCLSQCPRSRVAKDCAWAYMQVWCSFYDDFCQLARQMAYLTHAQFDGQRSARVAALKEQVLVRRQYAAAADSAEEAPALAHPLRAGHSGSPLDDYGETSGEPFASAAPNPLNLNHHQMTAAHLAEPELAVLARRGSRGSRNQGGALEPLGVGAHCALSASLPPGPGLERAASVQALDQLGVVGNGDGDGCADTFVGCGEPLTESPRSLDHYYGFGAKYQRHQHPLVHEPASRGFGPGYAHSSFPGAGPRPLDYAGIGGGYLLPPMGQPIQEPLMSLNYGAQPPNTHLAANRMASAYPIPAATPPEWSRPAGEPLTGDRCIQAPAPPTRRNVTISEPPPPPPPRSFGLAPPTGVQPSSQSRAHRSSRQHRHLAAGGITTPAHQEQVCGEQTGVESGQLAVCREESESTGGEDTGEPPLTPGGGNTTDQHSSTTTELDKWSDSDADAIVRGAKETAQMALSMYQFTKGEGDLNTTQDLFTQAELFAEEANELYKEVRCFSYKVPAGELKKELLAQLGSIPALVQQLQFIVKNPTVGKPATFAKVDSVIRETKALMEAVNRVVTATLACRQHYNMAIASMRKRTRTLSPSYRADKGFEFEGHSLSSARASQSSVGGAGGTGAASGLGGRHGSGASGGGMGSEPDI